MEWGEDSADDSRKEVRGPEVQPTLGLKDLGSNDGRRVKVLAAGLGTA